jgi:hypothetical protein
MTELRNVEAELTRFRALLALAVVMLALRAAGLAAVVLQVLRHDDLARRPRATARRWCPSCPTAA